MLAVLLAISAAVEVGSKARMLRQASVTADVTAGQEGGLLDATVSLLEEASSSEELESEEAGSSEEEFLSEYDASPEEEGSSEEEFLSEDDASSDGTFSLVEESAQGNDCREIMCRVPEEMEITSGNRTLKFPQVAAASGRVQKMQYHSKGKKYTVCVEVFLYMARNVEVPACFYRGDSMKNLQCTATFPHGAAASVQFREYVHGEWSVKRQSKNAKISDSNYLFGKKSDFDLPSTYIPQKGSRAADSEALQKKQCGYWGKQLARRVRGIEAYKKVKPANRGLVCGKQSLRKIPGKDGKPKQNRGGRPILDGNIGSGQSCHDQAICWSRNPELKDTPCAGGCFCTKLYRSWSDHKCMCQSPNQKFTYIP